MWSTNLKLKTFKVSGPKGTKNGCYRYSIFFQAEDGIRDDLVTGVQTCALPISVARIADRRHPESRIDEGGRADSGHEQDRKSTRLNSSHQIISYAVFCLKKKKNKCPKMGRASRHT